ncbi:N-acetylmuramic acid 6-phosphate etherase [Alteribacter salitolerans]|uniref:N-acetylmuramic acid 6-phosphate etherase n=1 Tax=Alteribacter salitolerans TaxID=2912333 RepID=UPI003013BAF0
MSMEQNLSCLLTEQRNTASAGLDLKKTKEILRLMNEEDQKVSRAVHDCLDEIEKTVDLAVDAIQRGGRLFYVGAGTSGRIGVLDAVECPPTFRTPPEMVQGIIAGGNSAMFCAKEGAEDSVEGGARAMEDVKLSKRDIVIGIAASGRTPFVIGALQFANKAGAASVALSCNPSSEIGSVAKISIETIVGPEILTGSTRLKSATAHKMVCNMISTTVMIKLGKVYENLMVDLHASNYKLYERAKRIVHEVTNAKEDVIAEALEKAEHDVKLAIVLIETGASVEQAKERLANANGAVRQAITSTKNERSS